jgi:hypothetical protein
LKLQINEVNQWFGRIIYSDQRFAKLTYNIETKDTIPEEISTGSSYVVSMKLLLLLKNG